MNTHWHGWLLGVVCLLAAPGVGRADRYVSRDGGHQGTFESWPDAATNLHDAVAVATNGETVWISNGTFVVTGQVTVATNITVKGYFGRDETVLTGALPAYTNRCFTLNHADAWLDSLTLSNFNAGVAGGGAVYLTRGHVTNCAFLGNRSGAGHYGAAIYTSGTWAGRIANCLFRANTAQNYGGGISGAAGASGAVRGCTFSENSAYQGGAVFFPSTYKVTVENCVMRNNTAGLRGGAAADLPNNQSVLRNSLLTGNSCASGGGVWISSNGFSLVNCTIVSNYSGGGGGIRMDTDTTAGTVYKVVNCIVYSNQSANLYLASDAVQTNWFWHCCMGGKNLPVAQGNFTTHPAFVSADPAAPDYRLQPDSPCVNTGTNQFWMDGATDVEGLRRLDRWQRRVDIGACEYLGPGTLFGVR